MGQVGTGLGTRGTGLRCLIYLVTKYMRHLRPVPLVPRPVSPCPKTCPPCPICPVFTKNSQKN